jgi:hypothetical protein
MIIAPSRAFIGNAFKGKFKKLWCIKDYILGAEKAHKI